MTDDNLAIIKKINKQNSKEKYCLFSDLDDTYILKYWPQEKILIEKPQRETDIYLFDNIEKYLPTFKLKKLLDKLNIPLIIVSGRDFFQIKDLSDAFSHKFPAIKSILDFDVIISAVGTEIFYRTNKNKYIKDMNYEKLIGSKNFDRYKIKKLLIYLINYFKKEKNLEYCSLSKRDLENNIQELPPLKNKISVEFISSFEIAKKFIKIINKNLKNEKISDLKILLSNPYKLSKFELKFNLDIVPVSKDEAINYLKKKFGIKTIIAGDSGNDYEMIKTGDYKIVPGNAKKELLEKLKTKKLSNIFFAKKKLWGPKAIIYFIKNYLN